MMNASFNPENDDDETTGNDDRGRMQADQNQRL
jgi:hypothetical protein